MKEQLGKWRINKIPIKKTVTQWLADVDYKNDIYYQPTEFSLNFINFIKMVNDEGEEHLSPVLHYRMLDNVFGPEKNILNMVYRGAAKTSLFGEYLFMYLAVYGELPGFGKVDYAMFVGDTVENGMKMMRLNLESRVEGSSFMQRYITEAKFTDNRWQFINKSGNKLIIRGYGAKTGIRGGKEKGRRPNLVVMDDLIGDEDAKSDTVIENIENTVYKAITHALHPKRYKKIWSGTPFNARDPLYKAVESGAWKVSVFPVCNKFPCKREEFVSSWPDRFEYDDVKEKYNEAKNVGKIASFNGELMLKIISEEERLVSDKEIMKYKRNNVLYNMGAYNFYITTDFATKEKESADYSVISVWAYNNKGWWYWVDGICKKQKMPANIDDLFRLCQIYSPQSVGIETSGQQGAFIDWIDNEMQTRNIYFNVAKEKGKTERGIRPVTDKMVRFNIILPEFSLHHIFFPEELIESEDECMVECMDELTLATQSGFKSKHDDFLDTISMLGSMVTWKPSEEPPEAPQMPDKYYDNSNMYYDNYSTENSKLPSSYTV